MADPTQTIELTQRVKALLRRELKLGEDAQIDDDMPLLGGEFELDSLDAVLLIGSLEKEFAFTLPKSADATSMFTDVRSIVAFLESNPTSS